MKKQILLMGVVLLPVLLAAGESVDLFGNWIAKGAAARPQEETIFGFRPPEETIFSFKPEGTKLTGTVSGPQGEAAIRDGRIKGDEITFFVIRGFGRKLMYKGKVSLNEIKFTVEEQDSKEQPREFIAKREFQRHQDIPLHRSEPVPIPQPPPPRH
jgi:hypothetical protein